LIHVLIGAGKVNERRNIIDKKSDQGLIRISLVVKL
jgi:hypothetical protein